MIVGIEYTAVINDYSILQCCKLKLFPYTQKERLNGEVVDIIWSTHRKEVCTELGLFVVY